MIRSELDVLLDKVQDPALRADLRSQIDRLKQRRSFGLVFEQHIPERVRLPQRPIRIGSQVVSRDDESPTWEVLAIEDGVATLAAVRDAEGAYIQRGEHVVSGKERAPTDSLVVISDFGEPALPGLRHLGSVDRGADKPYHVVIKGENHHALEALRFTHAGKVDCIYIDPPYNSGARDWKYNNDYVDENDAYRHSKWLAFMERRLKLAKELLNPEDSVLIVTIDEKEYLRLGLLLGQTFGSGSRKKGSQERTPRMQMVSITTSWRQSGCTPWPWCSCRWPGSPWRVELEVSCESIPIQGQCRCRDNSSPRRDAARGGRSLVTVVTNTAAHPLVRRAAQLQPFASRLDDVTPSTRTRSLLGRTDLPQNPLTLSATAST